MTPLNTKRPGDHYCLPNRNRSIEAQNGAIDIATLRFWGWVLMQRVTAKTTPNVLWCTIFHGPEIQLTSKYRYKYSIAWTILHGIWHIARCLARFLSSRIKDPSMIKHGDGARKRPCVFDDVSTVLFAGFAKKPMRFAIHSCGNVNVMTWIPCKGYRPKSIISTFAAFLLHFSKIASAKLRCVTLPHRSPKLLYKLCLQSRRHIHA